MMQQEFEQLAGYEVSYDDYVNIIEPMYLATNMDKADFVECINKKRFALKPLKNIIKEMKQCAASLKQTCTHYTDQDTKDRLDELIETYVERKYPGIDIHYWTEDEMLWSCYYPVKVVISGNHKFLEEIQLF